MIRNKELRTMLIIMFISSLICTVIGYYFSLETAILIGSTCLLLIIINVIFTMKRYRKIAELSHYIREISSGNFLLDVRDNYEGELSILKNEIYKVTTILSEHGELLEKDKYKLMHAISDISHQLKTPLTSMKLMADLLNNPELPAEKRTEFTQLIRNQLERIDWLVSSLLILAKLDAGAIQLKKEKHIVSDLVYQAIEPLHIPIDIKQLQIEFHGDKQATLFIDMKWTVEALVNILKNCMEHTPVYGKITITTTSNNLFTEIAIQDSGVGISKQDLPYIFQRFYRGENSTDDSVGIGLAMAYQIIRNQNNELAVTSEVGVGTSFILKFYHHE